MQAQQGNYSAAFSILNHIPAHYTLDSLQLTGLNELSYIFTLNDSLSKGDTLASTDIDSLASLSANSNSYGRYFARNMLAKYAGVPFFTDVYVHDTTSSPRATGLQTTSAQTSIIIAPNPVHDDFSLQMIGYEGNATLTVNDMYGRQMLMRIVNTTQKTMINVGAWASGTYYVHLMQAGKSITTQKITKL